ncbi:C4-dicarboxylate ABC transporter [Sporosarcina sp. P21c]|uniref:TRAP transporter substrate-binding protein n=1 Tax=unclassified Sporosarcina TaxID=2647733 RepID=UPI000C16E893|nr:MULTISPECIES: TRAP transporter substrate-binding protein [unclassified Sporosarcina]PIC67833.1 C4-dicarboxylate ABC transporter [Sporosarcina sp. P16a]PIC83826.1 C4-dicarboxylate ABC transporter [Sporosarcina sp. P1]PIC90692.1 C4-dicarboxylate ABC transporter [Sporosarcina sp. P21c]PIC93457.1 C4-dicarboxylate ABC transporter [Sporosarcina sp. P25]
MRKIKWMAGLLIAILMLAACGADETGDSTDTKSDKVIKWKLGHLADENHIWHKTALEFADSVKEKTDGQIEIVIYPNNSLGSETDTINSIQAGSADMVVSGETLQNWAPKAALMAVPYAFDGIDHVKKVVEGDVGKEVEEQIIEKGKLTPLYYHTRAPRNLTSDKKIQSLADLKGFSMRVPNVPLFLKVWEVAGAKPQVIDFNEVFTGLQQGVIMGQENPVDLIQSGGLYEVQKYVNRTEHVYSWIYVLVGNDQYNALTEDQKTAVKEAAAEAQAYGDSLYDETITSIEKDLEEKGMEFVDVDREEFSKAMLPAVKKALSEEQNEVLEKILEVK